MLTLTLSILLLIKEEREVIIITRDYPYSIYHSDNYETIDIEVLTNEPDSYHFSKDYIVSSSFYTEEEELSTSIKDIKKSNHKVLYLEQDFYVVTFRLQLPFESNNFLIEMEEVHLELIYDNQEIIKLQVGELTYLFDDSRYLSMSLSNLSATHEMVHGYNTIGGVNVELSNTSEYNILITDINILSSTVHINKDAVKTNTTCDYIDTVKDCIGVEYYDFYQEYQDSTLSTLLGKNNTIELYLPLIYEKSKFIYDFSIIIEYKINNQIEHFVIDNFPYMKTSIFTTFNEDDFHVYRLNTTD